MRARALASEIRARIRAKPEAALEARLIVQRAAKLRREQFYLDPELGPEARRAAVGLAERRLRDEPTAYLTGIREFYGFEFTVGPGVLIPRPETERLVDLAVAEARTLAAPIIVDVGTGSGAVAISVARTLRPQSCTVIGTDVSRAALDVAARNADRLRSGVRLLEADLLEAIDRADIVVSNLPYIPSGTIATLPPEISEWEPRQALDGGPDGLSAITRLVRDCGARVGPGLLVLEVGEDQADAVVRLAKDAGAASHALADSSGTNRYVVARWS